MQSGPLARLAGFGPAVAGPGHEETLARLRMAEADLARLEELAKDGAAPDEVIDRLRASLQARIGTTRARVNQRPDAARTARTEQELRGDLITAESAELTRLYDTGTISAAHPPAPATEPGPGNRPAHRRTTINGQAECAVAAVGAPGDRELSANGP